MGKAESSGAKSLEEILSSIRKSLADGGSDRPPEPRLAPAKVAEPEPKPASPGGSAAANGAGLSSKLAGALNGAASASELDDDLSDLLAAESKKPAPSAPADQTKPSEAAGGNAKDPLWFLSRLSAAAAGSSVQPGPAARARDAAKSPAPPVADEVKLSRPEVLRASLPPLFGASEAVPAARAPSEVAPVQAKAGDSTGPVARTEPRGFPPLADGDANSASDKDKAGPEGSIAVPEAAPVAASPAALAEPKAAEAGLSEEAMALTLASLALEPAPSSEHGTPPAPAAEVMAAAPSADARPESAPAVGSVPEEALQTGALEQMVAQMLEPVIRQWLQSNLPRMIEKVVREEVARAVAAEREASKA